MNSDYLPLTLLGQYVKDLSFENPNSPKLPKLENSPKIELDVNSEYLDLSKNKHEINLKIKISATVKSTVLFILELQYAGFFECNIKNEIDKKRFIVTGSGLLFPFARSMISNITMEGGFKPLILQPINFETLFKK